MTGPTGQVGSALLDTLPSIGEVVTLDRSQLDLANPASIRAAVRQVRPQVIVNAAAYTAVDQAEKEEALAYRINAEGPAVLAEEATRLGALLVHFSTDYVFDGDKPEPYVETDTPNPLNVYGRSKFGGEQAVEALARRYLILRTSWVYAARGKNFMRTMLRLAREGRALTVVDDQRGAPTSNLMLAGLLPSAIEGVLIDSAAAGLYHATAAGHTTWFGFAQAIFAATDIGAKLSPVASSEYETAARRPRNSVLDNAKLGQRLGLRLPSWQEGLEEVVRAQPNQARAPG